MMNATSTPGKFDVVVEKQKHIGSSTNDVKDAAAPATADEETLLFGVNISKLSPTHNFVLLGSGALFCALTFAALQEKVFMIDGMVTLALCSRYRSRVLAASRTAPP